MLIFSDLEEMKRETVVSEPTTASRHNAENAAKVQLVPGREMPRLSGGNERVPISEDSLVEESPETLNARTTAAGSRELDIVSKTTLRTMIKDGSTAFTLFL